MSHRAIVISALLAACAAAPVSLNKAGERVQVGKGDPDRSQYEEIGPIEAQHGSGCGMYGSVGTYEGAYTQLRNAAAEKGADYVELISTREPYNDGRCAHNDYVMRGIAFRSKSSAQPAALKK